MSPRSCAAIAFVHVLAAPSIARAADATSSVDALDTLHGLLDQTWLLVAAALVLLMQAGFLCLESGLSRAKNGIHVALKNLADFCVSTALFWAFGYALMFGASRGGWIGTDGFVLSAGASAWTLTFFLFQVTFCGTATTIVSGAVAERMKFSAYMVVAAFVSGVIYPVFGHWAWGGAVPGTGQGWLAARGFIDFAGSTVVHSIGGWVSLAAALIVGPRLGRFGKDASPMNGHNLPLAMLGALLLWFGWFGFNGGSTLEMNDNVPRILLNTCLAAAFGGVAGLAASWAVLRQVNAMDAVNGVIAGLVGVTACCHILSTTSAMVVGVTASLLCFLSVRLMCRLRIDDTIGAVSAHGVAGAWGTLCVALLADPSSWGTGLDRWGQLGVQAMGVATAFGWAFGLSFPALWALNRVWPLRVSREAEIQGLNFAEHGASTEVLDLLTEMQRQKHTGDFTDPVRVEPHTEAGQIAQSYNGVLQRFNEKTEKLERAKAETEQLSAQLVEIAHRAGKAEIATDVLHNVGNVLNSVNVSAGLVMENLEAAHARHIRQTAELINDNADSLEQFFGPEGRGRLIPGFLNELAEAIEQDQEQAMAELKILLESLDHIKAIVATQQSYAGLTGIIERVRLVDLIHEAEMLNASSLDRHGVTVCKKFDEKLEIVVEKQKLLQILVNLLRNAKEALVSGRTEGRVMTIRIQQEGEDSASIEIKDNGVGIATENLAKIFTHGFTTKPDGHGFGLHSCANAARELGGSLSVVSEGPGRGAAFKLMLPLQPEEALV